MPANAPDDWLAQRFCATHLRRQLSQALDRENAGKRVEIIAERRICRRRLRKIFDGYFACARSERIGANFIQTDRFEIFVDGHSVKQRSRFRKTCKVAKIFQATAAEIVRS